MEAYDPRTVFSSIDYRGRYAYSNQPHAMHWNLARLAETLLPLLIEEEGGEEAGLESAQAALEAFGRHFEKALSEGMRRKIGLVTEREGDTALADELLNRMAANRADFTLTFRRLCDAAEGKSGVRELFREPGAFDEWEVGWRARLEKEGVSTGEIAARIRRVNPMYIPRNHLVEEALRAAEVEDFRPFEELMDVLARPFVDLPGRERYAMPARPEESVTKTFCGT
jgi:uncharacterized protein YdiU (UPF0061 family)